MKKKDKEQCGACGGTGKCDVIDSNGNCILCEGTGYFTEELCGYFTDQTAQECNTCEIKGNCEFERGLIS